MPETDNDRQMDLYAYAEADRVKRLETSGAFFGFQSILHGTLGTVQCTLRFLPECSGTPLRFYQQ